jgi:hypothetical protein
LDSIGLLLVLLPGSGREKLGGKSGNFGEVVEEFSRFNLRGLVKLDFLPANVLGHHYKKEKKKEKKKQNVEKFETSEIRS